MTALNNQSTAIPDEWLLDLLRQGIDMEQRAMSDHRRVYEHPVLTNLFVSVDAVRNHKTTDEAIYEKCTC